MNDETLPFDPRERAAQPSPAPQPAASPGRPSGTVLGQYRLVRKIAAGGMGEVYEAIQLNLDRRVALKLVAEHLSSDVQFLQRFEREAKAAALINHPNIVQVYDFGCAQGQYYLAMEFVDGQNLAEIVHAQGKLDVPAALDVIEQTARALDAALQQHIVHRDIKPSNLLLSKDGVLKVSDLGLARRLDEASDLTFAGAGLGSPHFLAPEQASDARTADHRADIYSLGVTLLFLLTGKWPFDRPSAFSIVMAHAQEPLPTGLDLGTPLPPGIETIIRRMAAKNPNDRYPTYKELLEDVARLKQGLEPKKVPVHSRPNKQKTLMLSAGAVCLILAAVAMLLPRFQPEHGKAAARPNPGETGAGPREPLDPNRPGRPPWQRESEGEGDPAGGRFPLPMGPPNRPEFGALPDGPVPAMLAAADEFARTNKTAYRAVVNRYRQVLEKAEGTPAEAEVSTKMEAAVAAHREAAEAAIARYKQRMQNLLKQNRPQQAYDIWRDFPEPLRNWEIDRQIEAELSAALPPGFHPQPGPR